MLTSEMGNLTPTEKIIYKIYKNIYLNYEIVYFLMNEKFLKNIPY